MSNIFDSIFLRLKDIHSETNHASFSYNDFQISKLITTLDKDHIYFSWNKNGLETENRDVGQSCSQLPTV